ncbi:hypothetical protein [Streptomyces sp. H27-S2]|uniref:hypothetical protein n=1 Tax=Streptomyces antarcticus TaxID=2996458 RepID=UPI00227160D1|nr:hypothetical protein [Streptomyces sp. H27-S2]MCY0954950.1 hypothetical protein [Streptomyces sp. H27-S2]
MLLYKDDVYPEDLRFTNPDFLRRFSRTVDQHAERLPQGGDLVRGAGLLHCVDRIDEAISYITWCLEEVTTEVNLCYNGKTKRPPVDGHDRRAVAVSQCAVPLGTALTRLVKAIDRLSAFYPVLGSRAADADIPIPDDLLRPLRRELAGARTAMRKTAKQLRSNADQLDHPVTNGVQLAADA